MYEYTCRIKYKNAYCWNRILEVLPEYQPHRTRGPSKETGNVPNKRNRLHQ